MTQPISKGIVTSKEIVALEGHRTPEQLRADTSLSSAQRRKLLRQYFNAKFQLRQEQFTAALDLERANLAALADTGRKQIEADRVTREFQIRQVVIQMLNDVGFNVDISQLQFLKKFGEELQRFRDDLQGANIDPQEKEIIKKFSTKVFERTVALLERLAADLWEKQAESQTS